MTKFKIGDRVHVKGSTKSPTLYEVTQAGERFACKVAEVRSDGTLYAPQPFDTDLLVMAPDYLQRKSV